MTNKILILLSFFTIGYYSAFAQCGQLQVDFYMESASISTGDNDMALYVGIAGGAVGPVIAPPNYNVADFFSGATMPEFLVASQTYNNPSICNAPGTFVAIPTSIDFNIAAWENDCFLGGDDAYDCNLFCDNDDNLIEITGETINMPPRDATGCFTATSFTQTYAYTAGAAPGNCGATGATWTITFRIDITYSNPPPVVNDVTLLQGGTPPVLDIITGFGGTYQWPDGSTGLSWTPPVGTGTNEVDVCTIGSYPIEVQAIHECSGALSAPTTVIVEVVPACPELDNVTATISPFCEDNAVNLDITFKNNLCGAFAGTEGDNYLVQWLLDGNVVLDGQGPDGVANTADDITNLTNTTYNIPFTGTTCSSQTRQFRAEIICLQEARPLDVGGDCPYAPSGAIQQNYGGNEPQTVANDGGTPCPGEFGSLQPPGHDAYFNTCNGQFTGDGLFFNYDLSYLPACAEVSSIDYAIEGHSGQDCDGNNIYGISWSQEANFVFYSPASGGLGSGTGTSGTDFFWFNAEFCCGGTNAGGAFDFSSNQLPNLAGTSASGLWQILFFDDYDDTPDVGSGDLDDGELRRVFFKINYNIPAGCFPGLEMDANPVVVWDQLDSGEDFTLPGACEYEVTNLCSDAQVLYSPTGTPGSYTLSSPPVTPATGETVFWEVSYTNPLAPTQCNTSGQYIITGALMAEIVGTNTVCSNSPNNTTTLTASGGTTYNWSNGEMTPSITVGAGTYTVTVSDGSGCTDTETVTVTTLPTPTTTITPPNPELTCDVTSITLDAGAGFASYEWSPNGEITQTINATMSGTYTVTITDNNGCEGTASTTVSENVVPPTVMVTPDMGTLHCNMTSISLDAGAGFDSYEWSPNGETTQTINAMDAGTYTVTVTDANGCENTASATIDEDIPMVDILGGLDICNGSSTTPEKLCNI